MGTVTAKDAAVKATWTKNLRTIQGRVVSDKLDKTRVIKVVAVRRHPVVGKAVKVTRKFTIHDERNESALGDLVTAIETRPLSRTKRHRLMKVLEKAK